MFDNNKIKLIAGFSLMVAAFLCIVAALGYANRANSSKLAATQVQLANMIAQNSQTEMKSADGTRVRREPINLEDFLTRAKSIYGEDELKRKEGILWVDRKASSCMVTLGRVNGLNVGSKLNIYDGDNKIGQATVDMPLDIVSYVQLVDKAADELPNSYYRVVVSETP
jgi:hypothetical protein